MVETLLTSSQVKLYGRLVADLRVNRVGPSHDAANAAAEAARGAPGGAPHASGDAALAAVLTYARKLTDPDETYAALTVHREAAAVAAKGGSAQDVAAAATAAAARFPPAYRSHGANRFLQQQFEAAEPACLARIYSFAFQGDLYDVATPAIYLVHGPGLPIRRDPADPATDVDTAGVVARVWEFSTPQWRTGDSDLRYWEYDKGDFSLRLDVGSGPLSQILVDATARGADLSSGASLASGASLTSGASLSGGAPLRSKR